MVLQFVTVEEAYRRICGAVSFSVNVEEIMFHESYGRVLAEDLTSDIDIPERDQAHHDGYALNANDASTASPDKPVYLTIAGEIGLTQPSTVQLKPGTAFAIPTGGFLPPGANAVVMKELVEVVDQKTIKLQHPPKIGDSTVRAGSDVRRGQLVLKSGTRIRAQDFGLLASLRKWRVKVAQPPKVAILSLGSELVDRIEDWSPGKVFATHGNMITAAVREEGAIPIYHGVTPDEKEMIRRRLEETLSTADIITTIGGSSVGRRDFTSEVINSLDAPGMLFHGVQIQPGRMTGAGVIRGKPIVMLPGLVQSTIVAFYLLVNPMIRTLLNLKEAWMKSFNGIPKVNAVATSDVIDYYKRFESFKKVLFVNLDHSTNPVSAIPLLGDISVMSTVSFASGWVLLPEGKTAIHRGQPLTVYSPNAMALREVTHKP